MKASDNVFPKLLFSEGAAHGTPAAGEIAVYAKTDKKLYAKDDTGSEVEIGDGSGIPDAPIDGNLYGRKDGDWEQVSAGGGDVSGPASSTDSHLALWNGAGGDDLKQGGNAKHIGSFEVIMSDGVNQADITATTYGVNGGGIIHGRYARGTSGSPSAVQSGDIFGGVGCRAYHSGGQFQVSSPTSIHWVASENQTNTAYGSYLRILTTPKGSTTRVERVLVTDNGTLWAHGPGTFDPRVEAQSRPVSDVYILASAAAATGANANATVGAFSYGADASAGFRGGAAGGTPASPSSVQAERFLSFMGGHGYGGSSWSSGTKALLAFVSAQIWSGSAQGTYITLGTTPIGSTTRAERLRIEPEGHTRPGADNSQNLGTASFKWGVVYAGTGTINTSDARDKTEVNPLTQRELAAAVEMSREIGTFQLLASMAKKGDGARLHVGITVQRAMEIMTSHGLDPFRYAFICHDSWDESSSPAGDGEPAVVHPAGDRYGFRVDQLLAFMARGFDERLRRLESA